jgi:hypothetical protein
MTELEKELLAVLELIVKDDLQNRAKCPCGAMHSKVSRHKMAYAVIEKAKAVNPPA